MKKVNQCIEYMSLKKMWFIFFAYSMIASLFVQLVLPNFVPPLEAGTGLYTVDARTFHRLALIAVDFMEANNGLRDWELWAMNQVPAGIASLFYYLFVSDPLVLIPWNAFLHATAGVMVFSIIFKVFELRCGAVLGAVFFVVYPGTLEWVAQIHRDGIFILGNLLWLFYVLNNMDAVRSLAWRLFDFFMGICGVVLVWVARPYWAHILLLFSLIAVFITGWNMLVTHNSRLHSFLLPLASLIVVMILFKIAGKPIAFNLNHNKQLGSVASEEVASVKVRDTFLEDSINKYTIPVERETLVQKIFPETQLSSNQKAIVFNEVKSFIENNQTIDRDAITALKRKLLKEINMAPEKLRLDHNAFVEQIRLLKNQHISDNFKSSSDYARYDWEYVAYIPTFIQQRLFALYKARVGSALGGGNTLIDPYVKLNSVEAYAAYLPRALQIGLFSPFPSMWIGEGSSEANTLGRRVIGAMMLVNYLLIACFCVSFIRHYRSLHFWMLVIFSVGSILIYTYAYANVGTLLRLKYCFYSLLLASGVATGVSMLSQKLQHEESH